MYYQIDITISHPKEANVQYMHCKIHVTRPLASECGEHLLNSTLTTSVDAHSLAVLWPNLCSRANLSCYNAPFQL